MRKSIERTEMSSLADAAQLRSHYAQLLKQLMSSMKTNYQTLQDDKNEGTSYVSFVHNVIGLLQQHTTDITPIDRFFIDSIAFPLPAADPTYVVGRLRNYGLRLSTPGTRIHKQLVTFFQAFSERAAVDDQQALLVRQVATAISDTYEAGESGIPTLRGFLAKVIFPAYIEIAVTTDTGWIMGRPILQVAIQLFTRLMEDVDGSSECSVLACLSILSSLLASFDKASGHVIAHPELVREAYILSTFTLIFEAVTAGLSVFDYLYRTCIFTFPNSQSATLAEEALENVQRLNSFARRLSALLRGEDFHSNPRPRNHGLASSGHASSVWNETQNFVMTNLTETLSKEWIRHEMSYYLMRGSIRREIHHGLREVEVERNGLRNALTDFHRATKRLDLLPSHECELR